MFKITKAVREQLIGSIALVAPSGAGKTLGSLKIAKGMVDAKYKDTISEEEKWEKIGFIDTEHDRAKIYANTSSFKVKIGSFLHLHFPSPFNTERLDEAIVALKKAGAEFIIIDSISHFWEGSGGLLDLQNKFGGNFQAWADVNPHYAEFIRLVTGEKHQLDTISCIRTKQGYEVTQNEVGKLQVEKLGLKPVQRDSLEYEFQVVFNINMDHIAHTSKDNSGIFEGNPQQIETNVGVALYEWLKEGKDVMAEKMEKEQAERAEKEIIITKVREYKDSEVVGMNEYVDKIITNTERKVGDLYNLTIEQLNRMLEAVKSQEVELADKNNKIGDEVASALEEHAKGIHVAKEDEFYYHPKSGRFFKLAKGKEIEVTEDFETCLPTSEADYLKFMETQYQNLDEMLLKDLKEVAKSFNIEGYSSMKKDELVKAIKEKQ